MESLGKLRSAGIAGGAAALGIALAEPPPASAQVPEGSQFQVNTYTTLDQYTPSVAIQSTGDFVVIWRSPGSSGTDTSDRSVQGQRFDSAGLPLGTEFQVNTYTSGNQRSPAVAGDAGGDFVVVWQSSGQDGSSYGVFAQRFAASIAAAFFSTNSTR